MRLRNIFKLKTLTVGDVTNIVSTIRPNKKQHDMPLFVRLGNRNYLVEEVGTQTNADGEQYFVIQAES
jgi:co-chaperonin GroES (HSP10)